MHDRFLIEELKQIIYLFEYKPGKILSEQITPTIQNEYTLGTDKDKITNASLKKFGLVPSKIGETDYYKSDIKTIVSQSLGGNRQTFLSIFKPINQDAKGYHDYLEIGNKSMEVDQKGNPTEAIQVDFGGPNSEVVASHNGLLLIYRVMDTMNQIQSPINALMKFGEAKTVKGKSQDRDIKGTIFDLQNSLRPQFNSANIYAMITSINLYSKDKVIKEWAKALSSKTVEEIKDLTLSHVNSDIQGLSAYGGFVDKNKKEEIDKIDGWIKTVNPQLVYDLVDSFQKNSEIEDFMDEGNGVVFNNNKLRNMISNAEGLWKKLSDEMKKIYLHNIELYLKKYLPRTSQQLIDQVNRGFNPNINLNSVDVQYPGIFRKSQQGGVQNVPQTKVTQTTQPRKKGN